MGISTHILDTARGKPADGVIVTLERQHGEHWDRIGGGTTDPDGRVKALLVGAPAQGVYRVRFGVGPYFERHVVEAFYSNVSVEFIVRSESEHYHVPLLLNPFGFSTYRGS